MEVEPLIEPRKEVRSVTKLDKHMKTGIEILNLTEGVKVASPF